MKIPEKDFKIKIGAFIYEVIYSDAVAKEGEVFGSTHSNDQKIYLDPNRKKQKIEQTFIHEVLHAILFVNGLSYRFDKKVIDALPTEEDVCRETSIILYQVIKDNPKIFQ